MDTTEISAVRKPYVRVNGSWPSGALPPLTKEAAVRFARKMVRKHDPRRRPIKRVVVTSGNRYCRLWAGKLTINPGRGWRDFVHALSHALHRRANPGKKPHDPRHAGIEREMIEAVVASWSA